MLNHHRLHCYSGIKANVIVHNLFSEINLEQKLCCKSQLDFDGLAQSMWATNLCRIGRCHQICILQSLELINNENNEINELQYRIYIHCKTAFN